MKMLFIMDILSTFRPILLINGPILFTYGSMLSLAAKI